MMTHRIFYALPIYFYNTKKEEEDIILIENLFPNGEVYNMNQKERTVETVNVTYLKSILSKCDVMFFRGLSDGKLGNSVFNLVKYAKKKNIPVLELGDISERRRI